MMRSEESIVRKALHPPKNIDDASDSTSKEYI